MRWFMAKFHPHLKRIQYPASLVLQTYVCMFFDILINVINEILWLSNHYTSSAGSMSNPSSPVCPKLEA